MGGFSAIAGIAVEPTPSAPAPTMTKTYDRAYFDKWYRRSEVGGNARLARKVALAVATAEYHLERPIRSVLDIGCGEVAWRAPLLALRPKLEYLGFDSSEYAIARYGRSRRLHFARFADFAQYRASPLHWGWAACMSAPTAAARSASRQDLAASSASSRLSASCRPIRSVHSARSPISGR